MKRKFYMKRHNMCLRGQDKSVESGKYTCQNGHNLLWELLLLIKTEA